jgi:hypothetical protein
MGHMEQDEVVTILRALGVESLTFTLDGGGDSGDCDIESMEWRERHEDGRPVVKVDLARIPHLNGNLESELCNAASEWPEMDWVNNEGGCGSITVEPFSEDPNDRVCISMDYNEESEGDLDDDPELGQDIHLEEVVPDAGIDEDHSQAGLTIEDLPEPVRPRGR